MSKQFYFKQLSLVNEVKLFQVLLCTTNNSNKHQSVVYTQLNVKSVPFQTIQFGISTQFSFICLIDRTQSSGTSLGQSEQECDGNGGVLRIPQGSRITEPSSPDCFVSYPVYSELGSPLCGDAVGEFCNPSRLGQPLMTALSMALKYFMMRLQSWSCKEFGVLLHRHYFQVHFITIIAWVHSD